MIAGVLLVSSLAAFPLSPLPASDRHAQIVDAMAATAPAPNAIEVAQYAPPAGGSPMGASRGGMAEGHDMHHGPMFLRGLGLTEAQQDAIFNLHHAQAPQLREQMKALGKAREALHALSRSDAFDEQRAAAAAADVGRISATIELMRARTEAAVWKLLTPEQRQQAARLPSMMHGRMGPAGGEGGAPRAPQ